MVSLFSIYSVIMLSLMAPAFTLTATLKSIKTLLQSVDILSFREHQYLPLLRVHLSTTFQKGLLLYCSTKASEKADGFLSYCMLEQELDQMKWCFHSRFNRNNLDSFRRKLRSLGTSQRVACLCLVVPDTVALCVYCTVY